MLIGKICAIHYDNCTQNKLVFWMHITLLLFVTL